MADDVISLVFLLVSLVGFFLIIRNPMDTTRGRKRNFLGFEIIVGSSLLGIVYNIAHSFQMGNQFGIVFNLVCLLVMLVGSALTSWNAFHDAKRSKSIMIGLSLIIIIMIVQLFSSMTTL